jgi:polyisoprenoid-binding protein YceI
MSARDALRRPRTWLIGVPLLVLLAVVGGPFIYINFIKEDAPERLTFEPVSTTTTTASSGRETTTTATSLPESNGAIDGTWTVGPGSIAGYRVEEILFGQSSEAAGRTESITGTVTITSTTIDAAAFTVDLTTVASDDDRRDNQFHGRIMETATFPTATFELAESIALASVPADLDEITVPASGQLTLHGVTRTVAVDLLARRNGDAIEVNGTIPIAFSDFEIDNPSGGPAQVGDNGEIEFLLVLNRS